MYKYTDEQIKFALLECVSNTDDCDICPFDKEEHCIKVMKRCALDLINRQEAEIERLQTEADRYKRYYFNHEYDKLIAEAKGEAIKECTEKLKSIFGEWIFSYKTEDLFKEMVGENNGSK